MSLAYEITIEPPSIYTDDILTVETNNWVPFARDATGLEKKFIVISDDPRPSLLEQLVRSSVASTKRRAMPQRGEVWFVELSMAEKPRPALVISCEYGDNDRALITIVPHTTAIRGSDFEVRVDARFLDARGAFMVQV